MTNQYKVPTHQLDEFVTALAFNAVQHVVYAGVGAGKTITYKLDGESTAAVAVAATAAQVQAAFEGLSNVSPGDVAVTGNVGGPFDVTFTGRYAGEAVPLMTATATEGTVTITTTTAGGPNPLAVQRGTGDADATDRTDPLDGLSPAAYRAAHGSEFGDS